MRATSRFRRIRTSTRCTCPWVRNTQPCIHTSAASSVGPTQSPIGNLFFSSPVEGRTLPFLSFSQRFWLSSHLFTSFLPSFPRPLASCLRFAAFELLRHAAAPAAMPWERSLPPTVLSQRTAHDSYCIHCEHCPSTRHSRHWPHIHAEREWILATSSYCLFMETIE